MLQGALIGLGNIAVRGHIPAYHHEGVAGRLSLVAVADVAAENREKAREILPHARFYADVGTLLKEEPRLDFVDICTPPAAHAGVLKECAVRGIHIVCEKPLAARLDAAARESAEAVRRANVVFVPCHQYKYSPLWSAIRETIRSGALGDVALAQFNVYRTKADTGTAAWDPGWRTSRNASGGGILVDTGAHYHYLAQFFFGVPVRLSAALRTLKHSGYDVEDTALLTLEYPGTLMQVTLSWAAGQRANSLFIAGSAGSLSYDGARLLHTGPAGVREIPMPDVSDKSQYVAWYAALFREFLCRIEQGNASHDLLDEALTVMKLLDLSQRSSAADNAALAVE